MDVTSIAVLVESFARLLWSLATIVGAALVLWFLWQILQIGRNLKEYGLDYTGFLRGEIQAAATQQKIGIKRPEARHTRKGKFAEILDKSNKDIKTLKKEQQKNLT